MSIRDLSSDDHEELEQVVEDLYTVFQRDSIELDEVDDLVEHQLVFEYLDDLRQDPPAQPESALKDKLVNSASILGRSLFGRMSPEITIDADRGIVDYKLEADGMPILLKSNRHSKPTDGKGPLRKLIRSISIGKITRSR